MNKDNNSFLAEKKQDHRTIAKELDLYILEEQVGQGLPILLPNWVIIHHQISDFLRKKQQEFGFQEVITPILGSKYLYQTSGHLNHYQKYMFPEISRNNETFYLRPMTCPHHCLIYQQKPRSYRDLPFRLCENSLLFRYETSGALKGLERPRWFELADHHIFVSSEQLKEELKKNYRYIANILSVFSFPISRLVCALHDPNNSEKYHSDKELWKYSEEVLINALNELKLNYVILRGEAAFYGPKLDLEITAADGKNITISTIQLDFILPKKFCLNYIDSEQNLKIPAIIHQSPIGSYQRFIALLLEQTGGKLPFWLVPCQVAILPFNEEREIQDYCQRLEKKMGQIGLRVKIFTKKKLKDRVRQMYQKKIPYYLVIGNEETEAVKKSQNESEQKVKLKLMSTYEKGKIEKLTKKELFDKLKEENEII